VLAYSGIAALVALTLCAWQEDLRPGRGSNPYDRAVSRVRTTNARIRRALSEGERQSLTFQRLRLAVEQSDLILYIEPGDCTCEGVRSCLSFVAATGGARYVRVWVSLRQIQLELIEHIGHELRHAVEIADAPEVVSGAALARFLERRAHSSCSLRCGYETEDAQLTQAAIRGELHAAVLR
jgi:hypothetical protein